MFDVSQAVCTVYVAVQGGTEGLKAAAQEWANMAPELQQQYKDRAKQENLKNGLAGVVALRWSSAVLPSAGAGTALCTVCRQADHQAHPFSHSELV